MYKLASRSQATHQASVLGTCSTKIGKDWRVVPVCLCKITGKISLGPTRLYSLMHWLGSASGSANRLPLPCRTCGGSQTTLHISLDLNLTTLAAFLCFFAEHSKGQILMCLKSGGGLQGEKWIMSRHHGEKSCTSSNYLHHLWRD